MKEEVATLQAELAELVREQAEMDKICGEEKDAFDQNSAEMEKGLNGIKMALKVLNDYYAKADKAHSSSDGASGGIMSLTQMKAAEESAISTYETETKQNEIEKAHWRKNLSCAASRLTCCRMRPRCGRQKLQRRKRLRVLLLARREVQDQGGCQLGQFSC